MAIISFTNYKRGQTTGCMSAVMRYTMQDKKTEFEGQQLVTGINCQPESVYADFMTTKRLYHKTDGVLFYHMVTWLLLLEHSSGLLTSENMVFSNVNSVIQNQDAFFSALVSSSRKVIPLTTSGEWLR